MPRTHRQHCAFTQHQVTELIWDSLQPLGQCRSLVCKDAISDKHAKKMALDTLHLQPVSHDSFPPRPAPAPFPQSGPFQTLLPLHGLPRSSSCTSICPHPLPLGSLVLSHPTFATTGRLRSPTGPSPAPAPIPHVAPPSSADYSPAPVHPPTDRSSALYIAIPAISILSLSGTERRGKRSAGPGTGTQRDWGTGTRNPPKRTLAHASSLTISALGAGETPDQIGSFRLQTQVTCFHRAVSFCPASPDFSPAPRIRIGA